LQREVSKRLDIWQRDLYANNKFMPLPNLERRAQERELIQQRVLLQAFQDAQGDFKTENNLMCIAEEWDVDVGGISISKSARHSIAKEHKVEELMRALFAGGTNRQVFSSTEDDIESDELEEEEDVESRKLKRRW